MNTQRGIRNQIIGVLLFSFMIFAGEVKAVENGKIAFTGYGSSLSQPDVYTINSDGSNKTRLTTTGNAGFAVVSPDGNRIAFYQPGGMYLMNIDGSSQTFLTPSSYAPGSIRNSWSPDGRKIAFNCDGICIINVDGTNRMQVSKNPADTGPDWSPDGTKIAFTRGGDNFLNYEIYVMDVDGGNQTRLTNNSLPDDGPVWSPDGTKIAFTHSDQCEDFGGGELFCFESSILIMNANGGNQTILTGGDFFNDMDAYDPSWSPDGTKIAFRSYAAVANFSRAEIFVIDATGGIRTNLTNTADVEEYNPDWGSVSSLVPQTHAAFDYDADGRADLSVRRPSDNIWYLLRGTAGYTTMTWGVAGDLLAPADYDGDGKTDIAVFRPSTGTWFIVNSGDGAFVTYYWGADGDLPVPADHNADGKADLVLFRQSNGMFYRRMSDNSFSNVSFGVAGDKPVVGDFDNDGQFDIGVYRPSNNNWYIKKSTVGFFVQTWGEAGDIPVPSDYDGDGQTDLAVWRSSNGRWYRVLSTAGFNGLNWGVAGDKPIPADYDGDGKADVAIFRPSNGSWYIIGTTIGQLVQQFGQDGDLPTPSAFIY